MDLEAAVAELERQRRDLAQQRAAHPLINDDDARTRAPNDLCFPRAVYNMAATAYRLEDISDTPNPKTNEGLNEAK